MYQLGWGTVPRYLDKYYCGCYWEGILGWDEHLSQWTLSKADNP